MKSLGENRRCRKIMSTNCYSYPTEYEAHLKTVDNIDFYNAFSLSEVTEHHFKTQECRPIINLA